MPIKDNNSSEIAPQLPRFIRFRDLRNSGIVDNWPQLLKLIEEYGFPPGVLLSANIRAWEIDAVNRWIANRPIERKKNPARHSKHQIEAV